MYYWIFNELRKRDKMRGFPSILSLFHKLNKFNNARANIRFFLSYDIKIILLLRFWCENINILPYI